MGRKSKNKLVFRTFLLISYTILLLFDYYKGTNITKEIIYYNIIFSINLIHVFWFYLMYEMFTVFIPYFNQHSYSGKHLLKHFHPVDRFKVDDFIHFTKTNGVRAIRSGIFWILFNLPFAYLYFNDYISSTFLYWLFIFYYFFDTFCINVFCPFHLFITKNKCCNECRIYNWGHFMYVTPLIFINNIFSTTLVLLSIVILIHWEISAFKYPERFSPVTNKVLQCKHCPHHCRYNPAKRQTTPQ